MDTIGRQVLWSFPEEGEEAVIMTNATVRKGNGHRVRSYIEIARKMAELQFRNRDQILLLRGQGSDHKNRKRNTTLKPSLLRSNKAGNPDQSILKDRFNTLGQAETLLIAGYDDARLIGLERLKRQRIVCWPILQHYEVCATPLLDVTHSLRIAASFATHAGDAEAFLFVIGVPNLSGAVTASAEAGLQTVRLSGVCPPAALRPHLQEGYLLGEYPEMADISQKSLYNHYEIDFGRRLVAKFRFEPAQFWKSATFPLVRKNALYPSSKRDPLYELALRIKQKLVPAR